MSESKPTCWIITEAGLTGTENQCLGVAEALEAETTVKRIRLRSPWKQLSPWLNFCAKFSLTADSDFIEGPWPDVVLASGRKSIGIGLYIKKQSGDKTLLVQIQDPRIDPKKFDLVVVPQHDPTRAQNVITTKAALHRVTPARLAAGKQDFQKRFADIKKPRVAVLIGGSSKAHRMTQENVKTLALQLAAVEDRQDKGLLITASRRTGEKNIQYLRDTLAGPNVYFWDGTGDNPYFGFLALADYIIVTEDSVSMTSEALATGKPVYIAPLEGGAKRLNTFHKMLQEQGYTRPFTGILEQWSYEPPNDIATVAGEIQKRLILKGN